MAGTRQPPYKRQSMLVFVLKGSREPLPAEELFKRVPGYRETYASAGRTNALEKLFDRDREDLRRAGILIDTVYDPVAPGDRARVRYALATAGQDAVVTGAVSLRPEELLLMKLAWQVWGERELSDDARRGYLKLVSAGSGLADVPRSFPLLTVTPHPAFKPLQQAINRHRRVRFTYQTPDADVPLPREVDPAAVVYRHGRWLLDAWAVARGGHRTYLLNRILGDISEIGDADPAHGPNPNFDRELAVVAERNTARVRVDANTAAAQTLAARGVVVDAGEKDAGATVDIRLRDADLGLLCDLLAREAEFAVVLAPDSIRDRVVARLRRALAAHTDASAGGDA